MRETGIAQREHRIVRARNDRAVEEPLITDWVTPRDGHIEANAGGRIRPVGEPHVLALGVADNRHWHDPIGRIIPIPGAAEAMEKSP